MSSTGSAWLPRSEEELDVMMGTAVSGRLSPVPASFALLTSFAPPQYRGGDPGPERRGAGWASPVGLQSAL